MDFAELFRFTIHPLELVVRGTAMYWFLLLLFRFVLRRDAGSLGTADVLLLVLIADASQNAMAGGYDSVGEGMLLVATIVAWNYALDWLAFRVPRVRRVLEPPPLQLIRNGRLLRANMRRELVTTEELLSKLREHGVEDPKEVKAAYMESGGEISVLRKDTSARQDDSDPSKRPAGTR